MKAIPPWVSFRMIDGPEGYSGFFYVRSSHTDCRAQSVMPNSIGLPAHPSPLAVMPPARRGTGRAGITVMPCAGVQASRQPSLARPCGCVRLRGSTSRRRRKRSSPPPFRPQGLPHEPPGQRRTRASQRDRLCPPALYLVTAPYPARPRFAWTRPERGPLHMLLCLRDAPDDRCAATGPSLRQEVLSFFPVPADLTTFGLPVLGRCVRLRDRKSSGRFARPRKHDAELRAVGRQTLRADCLGPPESFPFARSRSGLTSFGCTGSRASRSRLRDREKPADAPHACSLVRPAGRLTPPSS